MVNFSQGLRFQARRINKPSAVDARLFILKHWRKSGSVKMVEFDGRQCVCLENMKRTARMSIEPQHLGEGKRKFTVFIYSPLENEKFGVGRVIGNTESWESTQGTWKRMTVEFYPGGSVTIEASGQFHETASGDKCYVDLSKIHVSL